LPNPIELIEDHTISVDGVRTTFVVRFPPYLPGTVHVFVNGILCQDTAFVETDPSAGVVALVDPPSDESSLDIRYLTFEDPTPPIVVHITDLKPGDVVRIAMKPGWHLLPKILPNKQKVLEPNDRSRSARKGGHRTVIVGRVVQNLPQQGYLLVDDNRGQASDVYRATVIYDHILIIQRYIPDLRPEHETAPKSHPGTVALGTKRLSSGAFVSVKV